MWHSGAPGGAVAAPAPTSASASASARIAGLDAWRALLILGGLFVHAASWLEPTALFTAVELISQAFRMGVFFAISGYLTAIVLRRRDPRRWIAGRLVQLGVPALFGVAVLCPLVWLLVVSRPPGSSGGTPLPFEWLHLWFLFGLIAYSLCAVAFDRIDRRRHWLDRIAALHRGGRITPRLVLLVVAVSVATLFALASLMLRAMLSPRFLHAFATVQLIAGYLPMFLMGFVLARCEDLRDAMLAAWRWPAAIVAGLAITCAGWLAGLVPGYDFIRFLAAALCPPAAFVLVLRSALRVRRVPEGMRRLSDASFTIYLLHLPVAVAINTRLAPFDWSPYVKYALAVVGAGGSSYAFHRIAVRRVPVLALLLNGRWRGRG